MKDLQVQIKGIEPLLLNNPQCVDSFNRFAKAMKVITGKRKKTDEDILAFRKLELEAKLYFDEYLGLYAPATWVTAAIAGQSWAKAKIKKADIRSCVFVDGSKIKIEYDGMDVVNSIDDIVGNERFHTLLNLKQGQVRVAKAAPIFHDWSMAFNIHFDDTVIDESELKSLITHASKFGGYGDFRPTYGRANASFE